MQRGSRREDARRGSGIADPVRTTAAILAGGGSGTRVGFPLPKQLLELAGRPMLLWALDPIANAGITEVVVVVPREYVDAVQALLPAGVNVVAGGPTRQSSVRAGLERVAAERVVVHDAARPFAPADLFHAVIGALDSADAAVPGLQMQETVKRVSERVVTATLPREEIYNIQTPQAFWTRLLVDAHGRAVADRVEATDDAQLIEHYGGRVVVVDGATEAFKVTTLADVERARELAGTRSR